MHSARTYCCVQVNWGLFSGKYLTAAVGSARSYVQVRDTLLRGQKVPIAVIAVKFNHANTALHTVDIFLNFQAMPLLLLTPSGVYSASAGAGHMDSYQGRLQPGNP